MPEDTLKKDHAPKPNRFRPSGRHDARAYAMQAMYQWQMTQAPLKEIEIEFFKRYEKNAFDRDYFLRLLHNIPVYQTEIDAFMTPFLKRPLTELDLIELAILRLSVYELMHATDIPYRVIINEALELAKAYGSIEGYKFVNGVLDQAAKKARP